MENLFELTKALVNIPTISGFEKDSAKRIIEVSQKYTGIQFDEVSITPHGSILLGLVCGKPGAKRLVFDAHYDTIGFMVTKHEGNGFVRVTNIGGIDTGILNAAEIELYGKRTIRAFFSSVPPHLSKSTEKVKIGELFVDTGLDDKTLREICPVGTPGGFCCETTRLQNNRIASKSLDDKICMSAILCAMKELYENRPKNIDVYAHFSCGEEKSMLGGATFADNFRADAVVVLDVNFAKEATSRLGEYIEFEKGPGVSISSTTSRVLTNAIYQCAQRHNLPLQRVVEMTSTGTNANIIGRRYTGIHAAVLSVPLRYMHTSVETVSLCDVKATAQLLAEFAADNDEEFCCIPVYVIKGGGGLI